MKKTFAIFVVSFCKTTVALRQQLLVLACVLTAGQSLAQSWVTGSPPNDSVATNYFPYLATKTTGIHYGSHNSSEIGDIYVPNYNGKPVPANSTSRPAVIVVHGGGGVSGSRLSAREYQECEFLAAHGYVAFNIDYTQGAVWPNNVLDWRLAVRYLRANAATYGIDVNHIGVSGGSFGGFCAANMSGITNGQRTIYPDSNSRYNDVSLDTYATEALNVYSGNVQCGFDMYGPCDQVTSGNATGQYSSPTSTTLSNSSSIYYVHPTSAPILIAHGTADGTVNFSQSQELTNHLGQAHVPYKFAVQPGVRHSFNVYQSSVDLRKTWMDWFDTYLLASSTPPYVQVQPANQSGCVGYLASFNVTANGTAPLAYRWVGPAGNLAGATNATYSIPSISTNDAGNYSVVITNSYGSVTSSVVTLTVNNLNPPNITVQPADTTVLLGSATNLSVAATGDALSFQWFRNNQPIANATNAAYSLASAANQDAGIYKVIVYNACSSLASSNAVLTVNGPPSITANPVDTTTCSGDVATFTATVIGTPPLNYQWFGPAGMISGATANTLVLTNLSVTDSGTYYLSVSNAFGSVGSSNVVLTVSAHNDVTFTTQPTNVTVNVGGAASFTVGVTGGGSYNYLWLKNDYDTITGAVATNATLTISNLAVADSGTWYHCLVGNDCSIFSSVNAYVTVNSTNSASVIIAEIYAAGGKTTAIYSNDYVVLKNTGGAAQSLNGWSLQHQKAGTWQTPFVLPNASIPAGGYYLIKCYNDGSGIKGTTALPTPDASTPQSSTWNLSTSGSGAVALVNNANILTQNNTNVMVTSGATNVVDLVGYVATTTTNSYIGAGTAPGGTSAGTNSTVRLSNGCQNTPDNSLDFTTAVPAPRNSSTTASLCGFSTPSIVGNPVSQTNVAGSSLSLAVTANGSAPLSYQWFKDSFYLTNNATASSALLGISPASTNDSGAYYVVVTNFLGSVTSSVATLLVTNAAPSISQPPLSKTVPLTANTTFTVGAIGTPPLFYQWRKGGSPIGSATGSSYSLSNVQLPDAGSFDVVVTNFVGSVTSSVAVLTVSTGTAEIQSLEVGKSKNYAQTTNAVATLQSGTNGLNLLAEVQANLPVVITGGSVGFIGTNNPNPLPLPAADSTGLTENLPYFGSKGALDGAFNNGSFHFAVNTTSNNYSYDIDLGATDNYPNAPIVAAPAADWAGGGLMLHPFSNGTYQLAWGALTNAQPVDQIGIAAIDSATGLDAFPGISVPPTSTNYTFAANLLQAGKSYDFDITFTRTVALSTNAAGTILYGLFESVNTFSVNTTAAVGAVTMVASSWATVRDGTNANVDINEAALGYVMAKYSTSGASAKAYVSFNLAGQSPDPTSAATLTVVRPSNSGTQRVQLWALNQTFAAMNTNLVWSSGFTNSAQANDTNSNSMFTNGPATATLLADSQVSGGAGTNTYVISPPWSQYLQNNQVVFVFTAATAANNSSAGNRTSIATNLLPKLTFSQNLYNQFYQALDNGYGGDPGLENLLYTTTSGTGPYYVWSSTNVTVSVTNWILEGAMNEFPIVNTPNSRYGITVGPGASPTYYICAHTNTGPYTSVEPLLWLTTGDYISFSSLTTNLPISPAGVFQFGSTVPPGITTQPANQSVLAGQNAGFVVVATGNGLGYQWQFNNAGINGATTPLLGLSNVSSAKAGPYAVVITNAYGSVTSSVATLAVSSPPAITINSTAPGLIQLNGNTITGLNYVVQCATNLASPVWIPVLTTNNGNSGTIYFQTNTSGSGSQFYRITFP